MRFLAGGGDGTVASVACLVADACERISAPVAPVAPLALGTGNELSRVLGWGANYGGGALRAGLYTRCLFLS